MIKILGTCAYPGSGQDTFANELAKKLNIAVYSMGDVLRDIAKEKKLKPTRENLQQIRQYINENEDRKYIAKSLVSKISNEKKPAIITGIRLLDELSVFSDNFDFKLVFVWAEQDIRSKRVIARGEQKDPKTITGYLTQSKKEKQLFEIEELSKKSSCTIDCNDVKEDFIRNFENTIKSMGTTYTNFISPNNAPLD